MSDHQEQHAGHITPFGAIRHVDKNGHEYWSARELYKLLGYSTWQKFQNAIDQAKIACEKSDQVVSDHFNLEVKMVGIGSRAKRPTEDYQLTRYACYLIVQNADPSKPIVALGQTYFAYQTRRQEIADELALTQLSEDQKRLIFRSMMPTFNVRLAEAAQKAGVIEPFDFAIFQDHGYRGLYSGETAALIAARKGLSQGQHILDFMGSEELGANIFRATQTDAKLRRDQIQDKKQANTTHHQVGHEVRQAIKRLGGTMPENLPTPAESIQEVERKERKRLKEKSEEHEE